MITIGKTILSNLTELRIRTVILVLFLLLLIMTWLVSFLINSQPKPATAATSNLADDFQSALNAFQKKYDFPEATAAYVLRDGTTGVAATGVADIETGTPMTAKSRMLSASIGKTFVGATVVALAREGVLDLDIPIARWLGEPQFRISRPCAFGKLYNRGLS